MAKINQVNLFGAVDKLVIKEGKVSALLYTLQPFRDTGVAKGAKKEFIVLYSQNEDMINEIKTWKENDIVFVKGVLVTTKKIQNGVINNLVYVEPIHLYKAKTGLTEEEARQEVFLNNEISNTIRVIGNLLDDPKEGTVGKMNKQYCKYRIAVERSYVIPGSSEAEKNDFPIVCSFGENAKRDLAHLRKGSSVLIDGCIHTRHIKNKNDDDKEFLDGVAEIIPFETEYLRHYITDEGTFVDGENIPISYETGELVPPKVKID